MSTKTLLLILVLLSSTTLAGPRAWIYLAESEGEVWLLNAKDIRPGQRWGDVHPHPGAVLVSTVHIKVSTFPKFNKEMQQQYDDAAKVKLATDWKPFQSVLGRLDDPKRVAYIELLADTNYLDIGNPLNHEWVAIDCASGDVGIREVVESSTPPTYHPSSGSYYGSTSITGKDSWISSANVPTKYHPLVDFICNPRLRELEGFH